MLSLKKKLTHGLIALATVFQMSGIAALMPVQTALAATTCTNDMQGANDEPGQKDLTRYCTDLTPVSGNITVGWQWDDTAWSGNNSGDACALFDISGDGNSDINFAVCATINGPASLTNVRRYSCGDNADDKCTNPVLQATSNATCSVLVSAAQPFGAGSDSPNDSVATCTIAVSAVGGANSSFEDVCSYPSQQPNSDPSDCIVNSTGTPPVKLEIKKVLSPTNDDGRFNLTLDGTTQASSVGNNGTTGTLGLEYGTYTVGETAAIGDLTNYTTSITCKKGGTTVAGPTTATSISVTLSDNVKDVTCTITNTRKTGEVKVVKDVVNNNGGTKTYADFTFKNNLGTAQTFTATTSPDGHRILSGLPVGSAFSITEVEANQFGYTTTYSGVCSGTVTTTQQVCTIKNDDNAPELTVIKQVINSNGANDTAADFTMNVTATNASPASFAGSETGTKVSLNAGSYSVDETFVGDGYTKSIGAGCSGTIALGEKKTCTITNTSVRPTVTLVKNVTNDNGGTLTATDFGITLGGSTVVFGDGVETDDDTMTYTTAPTAVDSNTLITISEQDKAGYKEGTWSCTDNSTGTLLSVDVTLDEGEDITCTITNDDVAPTLTLFKDFNNAWGTDGNADDFTFYIGANTATLGDPMAIMPGVVNFSESFLAGWKLVDIEGESCGDPYKLGGSFTAVLGVNYECTLVNEDLPAKLTISKFVRNDNSGTLEAEDFKDYITVDGYEGEWDLDSAFDIRTDTLYTIGEDLPEDSGYTFDGINCWDMTGDGEPTPIKGNSFTASPAQEISCTVFNDDIPNPSIQVEKYGPDTAHEGDEVIYTFYVTNNGDIDLSDVDISDDIAGTPVFSYSFGNDDSVLEVGETWVYYAEYVIPEGTDENVVNTAEVCANIHEFEDEEEVLLKSSLISDVLDEEYVRYDTCDDDSHELDVLHPSINVVKTGPASAKAGETVIYTFTVTNTGDIELDDVTVSDSILGDATYQSGDEDEDNLLDLDETWTFTGQYTIPAGQTANVVNTAKACGYEYINYEEDSIQLLDREVEQEQEPVCSSDSHTLTIPMTIVLGKTLSKTGTGTTIAFMITGSIMLAVAGLEYARRKQ